MSVWKLFGLMQEPNPKSSELAETESVRKITAELDQLNPEDARYIAAFAYVLGRVANADQNVSRQEVQTMEQIVMREGGLSEEQAVIIVQIAKTQNIFFGGIEDYVVTREYNRIATREQKLALLHCLYAIAAASGSISSMEDNEIRQIAKELKLRHQDYIAVRLDYKSHLEVLKNTLARDAGS